MAAFVKPLTVISATAGATAFGGRGAFRETNTGAFVSHFNFSMRLAEVYTELRAIKVFGGDGNWASAFAPIRKLAKYTRSFISV
ncbi:hypothetical protein [Spirosoma sp. KUDC1026]|uniref:hypothetical protein n=1 Tax=Spirosoma sp. KUDC1026 TaxID=2745947 RepID=UPI00159BB5BA|nr:hypothetical protein [Spirosoma sp. KUDC1026]QKZ11375.1 hypothetical protein HU175_01465 [Spirosoma sp. KUDC1026]